MGKLEGKVAVVTGGASGIGKASALLFAQEGAKIVIADLNEEKGQEVMEELTNSGTEALFVKTNVTSEEDVQNLFKEAAGQFGQVDVVFNNAGIGVNKPSDELTFEEWRRTVSVDLDGVFLVAREALRGFLKTGGGVMVNTASMYGHVGVAQNAPYAASKGGVVNLTRGLAVEYADRNIRINAICPGFIDTPIIPEEMKDGLKAATPVGRLGQADEIAKAVLFLASDDSSFMTGSSLIVDGGYTAQ